MILDGTRRAIAQLDLVCTQLVIRFINNVIRGKHGKVRVLPSMASFSPVRTAVVPEVRAVRIHTASSL